MWTLFYDLHSGGGKKEDFEYIFIEATKDEAFSIFCGRFGHNPYRVTCPCCGSDYDVTEYEDLPQATAYIRNCQFDDVLNRYVEEPESKRVSVIPLELFKLDPDALFIYADEVAMEGRNVE